MKRYAVQNSGTPNGARDIYQEALVAVCRNSQLDWFVPADDPDFATRLIGIVKNTLIDKLRKPRKASPALLDSETLVADGPAHVPDDTDGDIEMVRMRYRQLGARYRKLQGRFYFQSPHLRKIAAAFDWKEAKEKNSKYRCLKQLRETGLAVSTIITGCPTRSLPENKPAYIVEYLNGTLRRAERQALKQPWTGDSAFRRKT